MTTLMATLFIVAAQHPSDRTCFPLNLLRLNLDTYFGRIVGLMFSQELSEHNQI
jgi:hypothetical protein